MIFPKSREIESHGRMVQNRKLGLLGESKSNYWSLGHVSISPGLVKKPQNFIIFCLKVGHSANLKHFKVHMKTTYRPVEATKS